MDKQRTNRTGKIEAMKGFDDWKRTLNPQAREQQTIIDTLVVFTAIIALAASPAIAADTNTTVAASASAEAGPPPKAKPSPKKLTGAELYSVHCNRCHAERYPAEWSSREWQTLMTHMRVRANLPATQAREILKYLKEESGNP